MLKAFHNFAPQPLMFSWGLIKIYWYGFFIVLGFLAAFAVLKFLAKKHKINLDDLVSLVFYLFIFGLLGARIYDVFLEWEYYLKYPLNVFKVWEGGMAIHGAIIAGFFTTYFFVKKGKFRDLKSSFLDNFFQILALLACVMPLGQAIGRFGNYFNQELFGRPTNLPWGIFISPEKRPIEYLNESFFHPTFLYESLGNLFIFILLFSLQLYFLKKNKVSFKSNFLISALYLILYSILRFSLEFIRIDFTPSVLSWRFPQLISLLIILLTIGSAIIFKRKNKFNT